MTNLIENLKNKIDSFIQINNFKEYNILSNIISKNITYYTFNDYPNFVYPVIISVEFPISKFNTEIFYINNKANINNNVPFFNMSNIILKEKLNVIKRNKK